MLEHQKKRKNSSKPKKVVKLKKKRQVNYLQKNIKNSGRPNYNILLKSFRNKNYLRTDIRVFPNNIFCSIKNVAKNKQLYKCSAGKYKLRVSKKSLKYASKIVVSNFFRDLKQQKITLFKPLIVTLVAPSNLRKRIGKNIFTVLKHIKKKRIAFYALPKKEFNGCRARKQIRKKQKRFAIYK